MRVTRHPYEIAGWGVGELWIGDGEVVVAHDPPTPGSASTARWPNHRAKRPPGAPRVSLLKRYRGSRHGRVTDSCRNCSSGSTLLLRRAGLVRRRRRSTRTGRRRSRRRSRAALRAVPWGEVVSYGELSALAGRPRAARAAGTFCAENRFSLFVPCHRVVSAAGSAATARSGSSTSAGCSRSRGRGSMGLSDDLRSELAAIAPRARLLPARRDLGALPLGRERPPARPRPDRAPSRPRHLGRRPPRVLAPARSSASTPRSARTAAARSTARRATSCTSAATSRRWQRSSRQACSTRATPRSSGRRSGSSAAPAAAVPTFAARCSAAARSRGRARRISSCARPPSRAPSSSARSRPPATCGWASSTAAATPSPTRRGSTRSSRCSRAPARRDTVLAFEERSIVAAARGEANRLANADHANLVRTSRAAQEQLEAVRALQARRGARAAAGPPARGRPPPSPLSAAAAARARGEVRAADRQRPPSTAACRKLQELALAEADFGSEATLQGSWRGPGSPARGFRF